VNGKTPTNRDGPASEEPEMSGYTDEPPELSQASRVSDIEGCRALPGASQFPAGSVSRKSPSVARCFGRITLARLLGTGSVDWSRELQEEPFDPGPARETGMVQVLVWLACLPVLGGARLVHVIASTLWDAACRERSPVEELRALRMRLETGEITEADFKCERRHIGAARKPTSGVLSMSGSPPLRARSAPPSTAERQRKGKATSGS